ncbi:hypothetical protein HHI36_003691 [Cryptolaemus montrouzieri]
MAASLFFLPLGVFLDERVRKIVTPAILFVLLFSFLPHKELRFIIYVFPVLNIPVATACYRLWENRRKSLFQYLLSVGVVTHIGINVIFTLFLLCISGTNYPGGAAISHLHRLARDEPYVNVHISNLAAQTGVSRFTQINDSWTYSKTENLLPGNQQMYEYTHIIAEAKSKFSSNLKPYTFTHDIIDTIEAFHQVSFNYMTIPPVKIRTKPVLFILKRKENFEDLMQMRNFLGDDKWKDEAVKQSEFPEEEHLEDGIDEILSDEVSENIPQTSGELMKEETEISDSQEYEKNEEEENILEDVSPEVVKEVSPKSFKPKKETEVSKSMKPTEEIPIKSSLIKKKKEETAIESEEIDDIASVRINELKLEAQVLYKKKKLHEKLHNKILDEDRIKVITVEIQPDESVKLGEKNDLQRVGTMLESETQDESIETPIEKGRIIKNSKKNEINRKNKIIIDAKKDFEIEEAEKVKSEMKEESSETPIEKEKIIKFTKKIEDNRKNNKIDTNEILSVKTDSVFKTKIDETESVAQEKNSHDNKQQVKRNLKKLIQKYRRKKVDDEIKTAKDEKEEVEKMLEVDYDKQKGEIHKIQTQIMQIIESNLNIANKDLIKEKIQKTIIDELTKMIDEKIVKKTGKQSSAKDNVRTKKLFEAIEKRKPKEMSVVVQKEETLGREGEEYEVHKLDREGKIKEAQAKIEDIMNIIDEIVDSVEIHNS